MLLEEIIDVCMPSVKQWISHRYCVVSNNTERLQIAAQLREKKMIILSLFYKNNLNKRF